MIIVNTSNP